MYGKRRYVKSDFNPELLAELSAINKQFVGPIGRNIRALREYTGMSAQQMVNELEERHKFKTTRGTIQYLETGKYYTFSLNYLASLSMFFNIPLLDLATRDFTNERNIPKHIQKRKKENKFIAAFQRKRVA